MPIRLNKSELQALERAGSPTEIRERIAEYGNTVARLSSQRGELTKQYPRQWVAMSGDRVVCRGKSLQQLIKLCEKSGIDRGSVAIRHLHTEKRMMVL